MLCLIPAAGSGRRLSSPTDAKPLHPVCGVSLLERVMRAAREGGASGFVIVTGHAAERVEAQASAIAARLDAPVRFAHNTEWSRSANGRSVLAAREALQGEERFFICMSDHLVAPEMFQRLRQASADAALLLAVDADRNAAHVDPEDATRVRIERGSGRISAIDKRLSPFDGWDTGVFLATPALFDALDAQCAADNTALSDGVRALAGQGGVQAVDVSGLKWFDCDTPEQVMLAERQLLADLHKPRHHDGVVAHYFNRPLSHWLTRRVVGWPLSANQWSLLAFALCVVAAILFAAGPAWALAAGGVLAQLASVIDGCDGEIARLKFQASDYGGWLDASLDRYADALLLFGLAWHAWQRDLQPEIFALGFAAVIGSFMVSYTADKHDALLARRGARFWRIGRDLRLFVIFLGALAGMPLTTLAVLALVMNGEAVRRLWLLKWTRSDADTPVARAS